MRVIVLTSDKYLHALRVFSYLFNQHWSAVQPVLVAGFTPPDFILPDNFTFHSLGAFSDYPVTRWSDALIKLLYEIEDEAFVLMLEDYLIVRPVNTEAVRMCYDYCLQFKNVLRIDLTTDRMFSSGPHYPNEIPDHGYCGYLDLVKSEPGTPYQMSLMAAVWRRDNLLRCLVPNETPWDLEIAGSTRVSAMSDLLVLGTRQWILRHVLGHRNGDPSRMDTSGLQLHDVSALKELGWVLE